MNRFVDIIGTTIICSNHQCPVSKNIIQILQITSCRIGRLDRITTVINKTVDLQSTDAFVHGEYYHPYSADDINRHYAAKEALPENREFVRINNKETLAQVYTDIRYTRKDNEAMSEGFMEALKKQGFLK